SKHHDSKDSPVHEFLRQVPDYVSLERKASQQQWLDVASCVLDRSPVRATAQDDNHRRFVLCALAEFYQALLSQGLMMAPLETLLTAIQIEGIVKRNLQFEYADLFRLVELEHRENPREVRFHVDRHGRPAFVKTSEEWLTRHLA